jgi:hypothetical protein
MTRATPWFLTLLLFGTTALADPPTPDYSQEKLRQIFAHSDEERPKAQPVVRWGLGAVEFKAFGMDWRIVYLPIAMPFSGSVRGTDPWSKFPDPFALTGTEFASTPRTWQDKREVSKERRRIERSERDRAKVKVKLP